MNYYLLSIYYFLWKSTFSTNPISLILQTSGCMATYLPSCKSFLKRLVRYAGHCWRSRESLISDIFLWILSQWLRNISQPSTIRIHQFCVNTGCLLQDWPRKTHEAQLAGAVEYTDDISAAGYVHHNECPAYYIKQSEGEASGLRFGECGVPIHCHCSQVHPGPDR